MSERQYTVSEIDALREACKRKYLWGTYGWPPMNNGHGLSRPYQEQDMTLAAEQMTRTFMLAGKTADDLIASEKEAGAFTIRA